MTSPIAFPDWMPPWVQLLLLIVGIMLGLAFLLMPFSVFGVKSRLEAVEARLDEIQGEIRALVLRLPEMSRRATYDDEPMMHVPQAAERASSPARPPIPPAAWSADPPRRAAPAPSRTEPDLSRSRVEPRIDRGR